MITPPLSPINTQRRQSGARSPTLSFRGHARRRSSYSSNHDRSPTTPMSRHRYSNASKLSMDLRTPIEAGHEDSFGGIGNLADELDQLDDEDEFEDDLPEDLEKAGQDVIRDSGIDVSYMEGNDVLHKQKQTTEQEDALPPGLEDALDDLARLCSTQKVDAEQTIPSFMRRIQDLGNQSTIESGVQRWNTSMKSTSAHMDKETKSLQALSTSLLPPFGFSTFLSTDLLEETIPLVDSLIAELPIPDASLSDNLQKLSRETEVMIQTFASLLDTLQMSKQTSNAAARQLRTTQTMVTELRRERERADDARFALHRSDVEEKIRSGWAAQQCKDVVSGFESVCESLQRDLSNALQTAA